MFLPKFRHDDPLLGKQYVLHIYPATQYHETTLCFIQLFVCFLPTQKNVLYPTAG